MVIFDSKKNFIIVSAVVTVAVVSFLVNVGPASKSGLYVDIRKANRHIKAKNYDKGLLLLHKAFEEAPDSRTIGEELANGYLEYARHLNSEGDVDLAIEKVAVAYEMMPTSLPVINDLAYYLSARAVERSFRGNMVSAREDLAIAVMLTAESGKIKTNIANYFFNRAIDARDRKDTDTLFLCLETSYTLRPRFETIAFLGTSFYGIGDLENAVFYWNKALSLSPDDTDVKKNIERAEKEMLLEEFGETLSTEDFEVVVYGEDGLDRDSLEDHLLVVYSTVGKDLEYYPPPGTRIVVYKENDFRDVFQKDGIIRGFYDGNIRIALSGDSSEVFSTGVLAHEYTHAVISAITENKCPVWLHEGLAVYEQARYIDIGLEKVAGALKIGNSLSLSQLDETFGDVSDPNALKLAYEEAYTAVLFIIDEWGWAGVRGLLQGIREEGHFANAFDEKLFISVSMFEDMWNDFVKKKLISSE